MLEALWVIRFASLRGAGAGVVVLETGRVLGGDGQFVYVGSYRVQPDGIVVAEIDATEHTHIPGAGSVLGPHKQYRLTLSGKADPDWKAIRLNGYATAPQGPAITIELRRCAELP
jgi:hypothetical protein